MARGLSLACLVALGGCEDQAAQLPAMTESSTSEASSRGAETDGPSTANSSSLEGTGSSGRGDLDESTSAEDSSGQSSSGTGDALDEVPVIVSVAHGGQTARSCDGGETWHDFHAFGEQDDHNGYAAFGGIAFGNGVFVAATGWGAEARVLRSTDGVRWSELRGDTFEVFGSPANSAGGVEFIDGAFVLIAGRGLWRSVDGLSWTELPQKGFDFEGNLREVEFLPDIGALVAVTQSWVFDGWIVQVSHDGGATWASGASPEGDCLGSIQHTGGLAEHEGRVVLVGGDGPVCASEDAGETWSVVGSLGEYVADVGSADDGFYALTLDGTFLRSTDGARWTLAAQTGLVDGRLGWSAEFGYFGEGMGYARSLDGQTWLGVTTSAPEGFGGVREFAVGTLSTDVACP